MTTTRDDNNGNPVPLTPTQKATLLSDIGAQVDLATATTEQLAAARRSILGVSLPVPVPAGLTWDMVKYPISAAVTDGDGWANATVNIDPVTTYFADCLAKTPIWVATNGNDTTGTGSEAAPYASIDKAQQVGNASGSAYFVKVKPGVYDFARSFKGSSTQPTQKALFMASGGRVLATTRYGLTYSASPDATYTNCYTYTEPAERTAIVVDRLSVNPLTANPEELVQVATPAICNVTPGSFCPGAAGAASYINRKGGTAPTASNTYLYVRQGNFRANATNPKSVFFCGETAADGFDFEGGNTGCIVADITVANSDLVIGARNCTFKFAGYNGLNANGIALNNVNGLVFISDCDGSSCSADLYNLHFGPPAISGQTYALIVNCTGIDTGRYNSQSSQPFTTHESVIAWLIACEGRYSRGRQFAFINSTKTYLAACVSENGLGDVGNGGQQVSGEIWAANDAEIWTWRLQAIASSRGRNALLATENGKIHERDTIRIRGTRAKDATAVIDTW